MWVGGNVLSCSLFLTSCVCVCRTALMDQRDPNTVSGLLKLHLREYPFLSSKSVAAVDKVMQEKDRVTLCLLYIVY